MGASITLAGESLIAQKQAAKQTLDVVRFVLANVQGLNPNAPVDRSAGKPGPARIVGAYPLTQSGYVNPNQVVYSLMLGSDVGDFDFNWIGLETAENVLLAVAYLPLQQKRRNIPPQQTGNNLTRNFLVLFDGAQALTGITIDAKTWQHDFTARLAGIDERERLSNRDVYGRACFFGSSLQLEKVGSAYQLKPGTAYIEGIRLVQSVALPVVAPAMPATAWLDVVLQRELSDVVASWTLVFGVGKADYIDALGVKHYVVAIADLAASGVTDRRPVEAINGPLVQQFALRTGDYEQLRARATTKEDVELGNIPNAISDDAETNSSAVLATTKAVKALGTTIWRAIANIISGDTAVGVAAKLLSARQIDLTGAVKGSVRFDGSTDVTLVTTGAVASETVLGGAKAATQTMTNAGTDDSTFITPKKLRWGFQASLTTNGYLIFPSWFFNLVLQWGLSPSGSSVVVNYPLQFPTSLFFVMTSDINDNSAGGDGNAISGTGQVNGTLPGLSGFGVTKYIDGGASSHRIYWFAAGV